eukprot:1160262-Heterocapsa_arctica.AAC.1
MNTGDTHGGYNPEGWPTGQSSSYGGAFYQRETEDGFEYGCASSDYDYGYGKSDSYSGYFGGKDNGKGKGRNPAGRNGNTMKCSICDS